jgi:hypothetical protein
MLEKLALGICGHTARSGCFSGRTSSVSTKPATSSAVGYITPMNVLGIRRWANRDISPGGPCHLPTETRRTTLWRKRT